MKPLLLSTVMVLVATPLIIGQTLNNERPVTTRSTHDNIKILTVATNSSQTVLKLELTGTDDVRILPPKSGGAFYLKYQDKSGAHVKLSLEKVEGIPTDAAVTISPPQTVRLFFKKLPDGVKQFDLIEGEDQADETQSYWNFYEIKKIDN